MRSAILAIVLALAASEPAPLSVSAAISLTNVLEELAPLYAKQGGGAVRFNFGASNTLARQIVHGAPVDVFISADEAQMAVIEKAGAIVPGSRVRLLGNTMVIAVTERLSRGLRDYPQALGGSEFRRIAIGDPEAVPAGVYAKKALTAAGLWHALQAKLVPLASVRAALAAMQSGGADAALIYASDIAVADASRVRVAFVWPAAATAIVYPAAIMRASRNQAEAARFVQFLCGADAAALFERHRFIPLRCK